MGDFEEKVLGKLAEIHDQVLKTNGRVTAIEKWRDEDAKPAIAASTSWKDRAVGAIAVLTVLIVPLFIYVVQGWIK